MNDKLTVIIHKVTGKDSVTYYVTNLPEWWKFVLSFTGYCIAAMTIFYIGLWIFHRRNNG